MQILGMDTSGRTAAAAVYDTDCQKVLAQQVLCTQRTHSQVMLPMVARMLADLGKTWQNIQALAVANGPGSYTGLRIGIAAVQAMAYALQIPCVGVSTLEGLAWQCLSWKGIICSVMAARQTLVYAGLYKSNGRQVMPLEADALWETVDLQTCLATCDEPVLVTGDGADLLTETADITRSSPAIRLQNGAGICLAAAARANWQIPETLMPNYLQPVKAEKDLRARQQAQKTGGSV